MERINKILHHSQFQKALEEIEAAEKDRIFCRHGITHLLDTARLAYIYELEAGGQIPKEMIYAAALLHDIGRACEYADGRPHHEAGMDIAAKILPECGFSQTETEAILEAIAFHRRQSEGDSGKRLSALLFQADKASRNCFACSSRKWCKWKESDMNFKIDS